MIHKRKIKQASTPRHRPGQKKVPVFNGSGQYFGDSKKLDELFDGLRISKAAKYRVQEVLGDKAIEKISENPWQLADEIKGIGFITADKVAERIGADMHSDFRIKAAARHILKEQTQRGGHTRMLRGQLQNVLEKTLNMGLGQAEQISGVIDVMICTLDLVERGDFVALQKFDDAERFIAKKFRELMRDYGYGLEGIPVLDGLAEDQVEAVKGACVAGVFVLTGAPGTGKTFAIKKMIESFGPGANVILAAPTGKAAKRMSEQTGREAKTIHKILEPQYDAKFKKFYFTRDAKFPLVADLIVLDEVSMIDVELMARFLEAVKGGTKLVLVGDTYQLPAVGAGNVLKDTIASGQVPCVELDIIKRQSDVGGLIVENCHRIKNGENLMIDNGKTSDFFFMKAVTEAEIGDLIYELVSKRLPTALGVDRLRDIQVITPLREKTSLSVKALNDLFQAKMNDSPRHFKSEFKVGDKVIQTKNDYDHDILNGDIGYVIDISNKTVTVDFESPAREVEVGIYNDLQLAYAITCHKFQGSEAPVVVIPIHPSFGGLIMQRNWLYTAVSRARDMCVLVGDPIEAEKVIERNRQQQRFTGLRDFLEM